ncbi:hypothetical protein AB6A40_011096 [Gnathostoma spinigerum]|uniref:NR LBD domain-containing protein n=1 Tax=Gnathostoma spinigerum TaxID=75299 RepID=A0ABD6EZ53_9BILA
MDQLVAPMRFLQMDDIEFVALKASILFNPVAKGLTSTSVMQVLAARRRIYNALEHYVRSKALSDPNRLGDLMYFILPPLQLLANIISEDVLVSKLSGMAHIDQLMEELILVDTDRKMLSRFPNDFYYWISKEVNNCASSYVTICFEKISFICLPQYRPAESSSVRQETSPHYSGWCREDYVKNNR